MKKIYKICAFLLFGFFPFLVFSDEKTECEYYEQDFWATAYYSPLKNQSVYLRGSYASEIRLNGGGVRAADNTKVYFGMLATSKNFPFKTKIEIKGLGVGMVHDRGGAIVGAKYNNSNLERLDIWMGTGEVGLFRALRWGKRKISTKIYTGVCKKKIEILPKNIDTFLSNTNIVSLASTGTNIENKINLQANLGKKSSGKYVKNLQEALKEIGFFKFDINGKYDENTIDAVFRFQLQSGIIENESSLGAGHFGVKTKASLEKKIREKNTQPVKNYDYISKNLEISNKGKDVTLLQTFLKDRGFLDHKETGYFGEMTKNAVLQFQIHAGVINDKNNLGAGRCGPSTRSHINKLLANLDKIKNTQKIDNEKYLDLVHKNFARNLSIGDSGEDVEKLQNYLAQKGHFYQNATGFFGFLTQDALINFQIENHIIKSKNDYGAGIFGEKSKIMMAESF